MELNKVVIAPDSFKGSMSAKEAAEAILRGFSKLYSPATTEYKIIPMADGGEGTTEALMDALDAERILVEAHDPIMRPITSVYGYSARHATAIIELAAASGLDLLTEEERNPAETTSYGTGELIKDALDHHAKRLIIGLGGSATNDGGVGMMQALGVKFLDHSGEEIPCGGLALSQISSIDTSALDERLHQIELIVASDVNNPLLGEQGATAIYTEQKGATLAMKSELESALTHYHTQLVQQLNKNVKDRPGAGAAGGVGAALIAFLNAELTRGIDVVLQETHFEKYARDADLIITGEGQLDYQSIYGKTPIGVAQIAQRYNIRVIALNGVLGDGYQAVYQYGIDSVFSIMQRHVDLNTALKNGAINLEYTAENVARLLKLS
ncbi:glycerate kinase [Staphylococcus sp. SQ8-PEA]|uniref:Glycerate kinase n=1 Tax=Staphylococcus marylandisciuri TaxID=2981529 RepID=A0ABT2QT21_9STAP|nr:glycerate kinase [Staphylococcus marylandisciuri]MCU5747124.1 glycerate kinase [Staphylococcus marylandisciuri]